MPEPRKVFRIEQTAAARWCTPPLRATASPHARRDHAGARRAASLDGGSAGSTAAIRRARETAGVGDDPGLQAEDMTRIAHELDAVTAGTAQATQKILAAAEEIDQLADNLSAALKGRLEQELAQDIADSVLRIFEACNFQDLIGQRVAKVMKTLTADDEALAPAVGARIGYCADIAAGFAWPAARQRQRPHVAKRNRRDVRRLKPVAADCSRVYCG